MNIMVKCEKQAIISTRFQVIKEMKEICKRCKKKKELATSKPRLCHDCVIAEGKRMQE